MRQEYPIETLQNILNHYPNLGLVKSLHLFTSGAENTNYLVVTDISKVVIKIFEGRGVAPATILFEIEVMNAVHKAGIKGPALYPQSNGSFQTMQDGKFAVVMEYIDGTNMLHRSVSDEIVASVGEELGKMDVALGRFTEGSKTRQQYEFDLKHFLLLEDKINLLPHGIDREPLYQIVGRFRQVKNQFLNEAAGIIHNDVGIHNILVKDEKLVAIIDFSDVVYSPYIQNVAVALANTVFTHNWQPHQATILLKNYNRFHPLPKDSFSLLYDLVLARHAQFAIAFNRWNVEYGVDSNDTHAIDDYISFMQRLLDFGRNNFERLLL